MKKLDDLKSQTNKLKGDTYLNLNQLEEKLMEALEAFDLIIRTNIWKFLLLELVIIGIVFAIMVYVC